jgi:hypothetical protein
MADLSIVICCYAPVEEVFSRTLAAVRNLNVPEQTQVECVIVDNNNSTPLASLPYVQAFLSETPWASIVVEVRQGLTYARLAGLAATSAPVVIFFDDDNEPAEDYLVIAARCLDQHPDVHVWGPGNTVASFDPSVGSAFREEFAELFQEREFASLQYGCVPAKWEPYYPFGTGMIARRGVLVQYRDRILGGELGSTDRSGKLLSSGGDTQIVWEAVRMGHAAGICPELKMTHVISSHRASRRYIARLLYGTGSSYLPALVESFPAERRRLGADEPSNYEIAVALCKIVAKATLRGRLGNLRIQLARYLGPAVGLINVTGAKNKQWVRTLASRLSLE